MVSHLLNIDENLAHKVADKLGLQTMPKPADAAVPTRQDLNASPALSIVKNGPGRFERSPLRYTHWLDGDGFVCAIAFAHISITATALALSSAPGHFGTLS